MTDETIAEPVEETAPPRTLSIAAALESLSLLLIALVVLVRVVPEFAQLYERFSIPLSWTATLIVECSRFVCGHLWLIGIAVLAVPFCLVRLSERDRKIVRHTLPWLAILFSIGTMVALFLPLIGLSFLRR